MQSLLLGFDEAGAPQHLEVRRRVGQGHPRLAREILDMALTLRQQVEQLEPVRAGQRLAEHGQLAEDSILERGTRHDTKPLFKDSFDSASIAAPSATGAQSCRVPRLLRRRSWQRRSCRWSAKPSRRFQPSAPKRPGDAWTMIPTPWSSTSVTSRASAPVAWSRGRRRSRPGRLLYKADNEVPEEWRDARLADRSRPIITQCDLGPLSAIAAKNLQDMGFTNVSYLEGGIQGWKQAGLPTESPSEAGA